MNEPFPDAVERVIQARSAEAMAEIQRMAAAARAALEGRYHFNRRSLGQRMRYLRVRFFKGGKS